MIKGRCCCEERSTVVLRFKREALLYDIRNVAYVESDVRATEDEHARHQTADIGETGNVDRVTRMLNLAFQECVNFIKMYTRVKVGDCNYADDAFGAPEEYVMMLRVPVNFTRGSVMLLKDLIHEYMVSAVLYDWLSITAPEAAAKWGERAEILKNKIGNTAAFGGGMVTLKMQPF